MMYARGIVYSFFFVAAFGFGRCILCNQDPSLEAFDGSRPVTWRELRVLLRGPQRDTGCSEPHNTSPGVILSFFFLSLPSLLKSLTGPSLPIACQLCIKALYRSGLFLQRRDLED